MLACTQPETLLRVAMHGVFACEVLHRPWAQNRYTLGCHAPCGPEVNLPQMKAVAHRLVIPQLVRVIAMDAVSSRDSTGCETDDYLQVHLRTPGHRPFVVPSVLVGLLVRTAVTTG